MTMMYQNNSAIKDEILKSYIQQIFNRYDTQGQGSLGANDITSFFNDLFRSLNINLVLNAQQSYEAIRTVYTNFTTSITRDELFQVFKVILGLSSPQPQANMAVNQFGGYNPTVIGNNYMNPQGYFAGNLQGNYMQQGQNYVIAQNMLRQGQNFQGGYPQVNLNPYAQQNLNNNQQQFNNFRR